MAKKPQSNSQRLRAVLFLLFQKEPGEFTDFELYYNNKIEQIINHFKTKL